MASFGSGVGRSKCNRIASPPPSAPDLRALSQTSPGYLEYLESLRDIPFFVNRYACRMYKEAAEDGDDLTPYRCSCMAYVEEQAAPSHSSCVCCSLRASDTQRARDVVPMV